MHQFDPCQPLAFLETDPDRDHKERALHAMSNDDLLALYNLTRAAASEAHKTHDMEKVYPLVRGMKTLQRITGERGFIIRARRLNARP
tara:strand:+ start:391 stop:654 length:264 start_codon:yes stop_codon:yes gene_type:complete